MGDPPRRALPGRPCVPGGARGQFLREGEGGWRPGRGIFFQATHEERFHLRLHGLAEALAGGNRRFVEMLAAEFGAGFAVEDLASGQQEIAEHADGINIAPGIALIRIADGLGRDEVGRARGAGLAETLAKEERQAKLL